MNGKALFNGGFPKLEGTDTIGLKDSNGKLFVIEMVRVAKSNGLGWVDYMWPKPGQSQSSQKWSYIKSRKHRRNLGLRGRRLLSVVSSTRIRFQSGLTNLRGARRATKCLPQSAAVLVAALSAAVGLGPGDGSP